MSLTGKLGTPLPLRLGTIETSITAGYGQAQAFILAQFYNAFGQAQASIKATSNKHAQAQARIVDDEDCNTTSPTGNVLVVTGTVETLLPGCDVWVVAGVPVNLTWNIWISHNNTGTFKRETIAIRRDSLVGAIVTSFDTGLADGGDSAGGHQFNWTGSFLDTSPTTGHYVATVVETAAGVGNPANTQIWSDTRTFCAQTSTTRQSYAQAQASILAKSNKFGQAQADIKQTYQTYGQAQAEIVYKRWSFGQAEARILLKRFVLGQAQASVLQVYQQYAQAQALIVVRDINAFGQARASIVYKRWSFGQAQAFIVRGNPGGGGGGGGFPLNNFGPPEYVVVYDGFQLPGYPQTESLDVDNRLADYNPFGWDGSSTQQAGLNNPHIQMEFLIYTASGWGNAKDQYHMAERILLSDRTPFAPLYIDYNDRHWNASIQSVDYQKDAAGSRRTLQYTVHWEVEPWIVSDEEHEITGAAGIISTTDRTLANGAWTPTLIEVTGTNVTISGYTDTEFTGYISVSGVVNGMIIDTEAYTAEIGGVNAVGRMYWKDFALFVGVGITNFDVTGASSISIKYRDRWY